MTTRDERFLTAWDDRFGDGCELSPEDIVERWAVIAEDYPGGWVQMAVELCAGLPDETSEPEFFTLPSGETVDITPPTWRDVVAELVGGIRSAALSMVEGSAAFSVGAERDTRFRPGSQPSRKRGEHMSVLAEIAVILQCAGGTCDSYPTRRIGGHPGRHRPRPAQDVGRTTVADRAAAGRKTQ